MIAQNELIRASDINSLKNLIDQICASINISGTGINTNFIVGGNIADGFTKNDANTKIIDKFNQLVQLSVEPDNTVSLINYIDMRSFPFENMISVLNNMTFKTVTSVVVTGPNDGGIPIDIYEGQTANFTCVVNWDDGTYNTVTGTAAWEVSETAYGPGGVFTSPGVLQLSNVLNDQEVTVTASYAGSEGTWTFTILNNPEIVSLEFTTAPTTVDINGVQYSCFATWNNSNITTETSGLDWELSDIDVVSADYVTVSDGFVSINVIPDEQFNVNIIARSPTDSNVYCEQTITICTITDVAVTGDLEIYDEGDYTAKLVWSNGNMFDTPPEISLDWDVYDRADNYIINDGSVIVDDNGHLTVVELVTTERIIYVGAAYTFQIRGYSEDVTIKVVSGWYPPSANTLGELVFTNNYNTVELVSGGSYANIYTLFPRPDVPGMRYFEITVNNLGMQDIFSCGLADLGVGRFGGAVQIDTSGTIRVNYDYGVYVIEPVNWPSFYNGMCFGFAVSGDRHWVSLNGIWADIGDGIGNPSAGTNPVVDYPISNLEQYADLKYGDKVTINNTGPFQWGPPSGFNAWVSS